MVSPIIVLCDFLKKKKEGFFFQSMMSHQKLKHVKEAQAFTYLCSPARNVLRLQPVVSDEVSTGNRCTCCSTKPVEAM